MTDLARGSRTEFALKLASEREILVVEDEPLLRRMLVTTLARIGLQIVAVDSAAAALALVGADPARFSLVITDLTMPEMNGCALACELRRIAPALPVVLSTGAIPEMLEADLFSSVLIKPYTRQLLVDAIAACVTAAVLAR